MSLVAEIVGRLPRSWIKAASRAQWRSPMLKRGFDWCAGRLRDRDGVIRQGVGKGLRFNTGRSNAGYLLGTAEPEVQLAMAAIIGPGMTVFDAGANVGFHSMLAARLTGLEGRVISFEPLPENAARIEYNARLNRFSHIEVRREAVGRLDGAEFFQLSAEPTWGKLKGAGGEPSRFTGEIRVPVRTLDSLTKGGELPPPDVIKIDVEGAETGVLAGAAETLRRDRPMLMIELHGTNAPVAEALRRLGYRAGALGRNASIEESPWYAYVIAAPEERAELVEIQARLCRAGEEGGGGLAASARFEREGAGANR